MWLRGVFIYLTALNSKAGATTGCDLQTHAQGTLSCCSHCPSYAAFDTQATYTTAKFVGTVVFQTHSGCALVAKAEGAFTHLDQ